MNIFDNIKKLNYKKYLYENKLIYFKKENNLLFSTLILFDKPINNKKNFKLKLQTNYFYVLNITLSEPIKGLLNKYIKRVLKFPS
jgi:HJR/Mrr/RecB family endonuclease